MSTDDRAQKVYDLLDSLEIEYQAHTHPPVHTIEEAAPYWKDIPGAHCKNLFLRDGKGKNHFLVVLPGHKSADLKGFAALIGSTRLSFASPGRLNRRLGLEPGSVSVLGIINDEENHVRVFIDREILDEEFVNFHPNVNTVTLTIQTEGFRKFLESQGNEVSFIEIDGWRSR